jgi:hypothetical protein
MRVTHPHFRIEFPEQFKGSKHVANRGRVFVKFTETEEFELPQVKDVQLNGPATGVWTIELTFIASAEVEYVDAEDGEG